MDSFDDNGRTQVLCFVSVIPLTKLFTDFMKKILFGSLLFTFLCGTAYSQSQSRPQATVQAVQDPVAHQKEVISRSHSALFKLPYPKEYIRDVIVAEINENKPRVAPHYPQRAGATTAIIDQWITQYPGEVAAYIRLVNITHRKYALAKP